MAVTFSSAVSAANPAVVDTDASQDTGAATQGIGLVGADGASLGGAHIGESPSAVFKFETGDGVGV